MPGWDTGDAFIGVVVNLPPVFEVATTLLNFYDKVTLVVVETVRVRSLENILF